MRPLVLLCLSTCAASAVLDKRDPVPQGYVAPPYYPTPHGGWVSEWSESYRKAALLVANMTLAEKTNITSGTGIFMGRCVGNTGSALRVGIPQLCLQDGPLGVRNTDHNTAFPPGITVGATWNKDLMHRRGIAIGEEFRGKGVNVYLGPSVGALGRKPRGGRNWEGFGSDPVLQAFGGALTIEGVQSTGVIATIKHLVANEQEMYRMYSLVKPGISSNLDDRTMHELYLWPFAEGVRAGVGSVMISYNAVNGSAAAQNSYLMNGLLKDELGFQGFVMSDWLAQISGVPSALAGLDMSMPGDRNEIPLLGNSYWMYDYSRAVLNGSVPVDRLNDAVARILAAYFQMGQDQNYPRPNFDANTQDAEGPLYPGALFSPRGIVNEFVDVQGNHAEVAREVARDAITLLKNQGNILPLSRNATLKVFGTDAEKNPDGINSCADQGCNKGTLGMGWGSGSARYPYMDSPIDGFKSRGSNYQFFNIDSFPSNSNPSPNDTAIVFVTADSGENYITVEGNPGDRTSSNLNLWHNGDKLVQDVAAKYSNVIVVLHTVGPIIMEAWHDLPSVKAVLAAHLPGQEAGKSLMDVLFGDVSPSGHLPYTVPRSEEDYPDSVNLVGYQLGQPQDTFTEGLYIDYRHFHRANVKPRYAFGHGLSYTSFTFSDASITALTPLTSVPPTRPAKGTTPAYSTAIPPASEAYWPENFNRIWRYLYSWLEKKDADDAAAAANSTTKYPYPAGYSNIQKPGPVAGGAQGGNPALFDIAYNVSVTIINTGARPGKAVAQVYVQFPQGIAVDTPVVQLRDFEKTNTLQPGASQTLNLRVTRKDLSVWDTGSQNWIIPSINGDYGIWNPNQSVTSSATVPTASATQSTVPSTPQPTSPVTNPGLTIDTPNGNYSGCYEDALGGTGVALFDGPTETGVANLTQESCQQFCTDAPGGPYRYFGIGAGGVCSCGNTFQHDAIPYDGTTLGCDTPCPGDDTQACGGNNRLSVYANNDFLAAPVQTSSTAITTPAVPTTPITEPTVPISITTEPAVTDPNATAGPIQTSSISIPAESLPIPTTTAPVESNPGATDLPVETATTSTVPVESQPAATVAPLPTRLPVYQPYYPDRPPSDAGDGVDAPYFYNGAWQPRPYPGGNGGNRPTRPRPTNRRPARPVATRRPWKSRPTVRPWEGGNGYRANRLAARAERRWFGLW